MKANYKILMALLAGAFVFGSCEKTPANPGSSSGGGFEEPVPEKPEYVNAIFRYHGDDGMGDSDWWELVLYTDMEMLNTTTPLQGTGPGQAIYFTLNAPYNPAQTADLHYVAGDYHEQSNSGDFSEGTFQGGEVYEQQIPGGIMQIPDGTYFCDFPADGSEYEPDLLKEGQFTITANDDGTCTVEGILVGTEFIKRYFSFTGTPVVESETTGGGTDVPNSTLTEDLSLPQFTKAWLVDRKDTYTGLVGDGESPRAFALFLANGTIDVSGGTYGQTITGSGQLMRIEFFVSWDTDVEGGIPAGDYVMAQSYPDGGILRDEIVPGKLAPGYPDKFENFTGTWYVNLQENADGGQDWIDYARIAGGTVSVTRDGDACTLIISLEDCSEPAWSVSGTWTSDSPVEVLSY